MGKVRILLMGGFAELAESELTLQGHTYAEVVLEVAKLYPQLKPFLLEGDQIRSDLLGFVRGRVVANPHQELADGDEISLYPPVTW